MNWSTLRYVVGRQEDRNAKEASQAGRDHRGLALGKWRALLKERGHFMGKPQRRFGKGFEAEAVRLVEVSGRTQREIAMDLGVGLSTLRRWLDKRRENEIEAPPPERQEDQAAELKRLRRENEILRQEREILKKAATFFAKEGSR